MQLPYLTETRKTVMYTQDFAGYNHNLRSGADDDGSFWDMKNMSLVNYPVIQTRYGRIVENRGAAEAIMSRFPVGDNCLEVDGTKVYKRGSLGGSPASSRTEIAGLTVENSEKQFASIGAYVLIMPDGVVINTAEDTWTYDQVHFEREAHGGSLLNSIYIRPVVLAADGTYEQITYVSSSTAPTDTNVYWYDTENKSLKKYSPISYTWVGVGTAYLSLFYHPAVESDYNFFEGFKVGDTITIANLECESGDPDEQAELDLIARNSAEEGKGDNLIYYAAQNEIVIAGFLTTDIEISYCKIERRIPDMDFITAYNNRIWGCSSSKHEVYACKLGDATQWYNYAGLASDSYAATIGGHYEFTGASVINSSVLFFKENSILKVYGDYPSNFQINETACEGVKKRCHKSICLIDGALYYYGINGPMVYDGSLPSAFTSVFGEDVYANAAAGTVNGKYYISMLYRKIGQQDAWRVFVYDTKSRTWVKDDDLRVRQFYSWLGDLRAIQYEGGESYGDMQLKISTTYLKDGIDTTNIDWYLITNNLGLNTPNQKYISRVQLRFDMIGEANIQISRDDDDFVSGEGVDVFHVVNTTGKLKSYNIPIRVKRCDHFRIKMYGTGHIKLYSYGYNVEQGSERP